jgi:hypothetical protein
MALSQALPIGSGHRHGQDVGRTVRERPHPVVDALLAATAVLNDLTLVTRNIRDVTGIPVKQHNPWTGQPTWAIECDLQGARVATCFRKLPVFQSLKFGWQSL